MQYRLIYHDGMDSQTLVLNTADLIEWIEEWENRVTPKGFITIQKVE